MSLMARIMARAFGLPAPASRDVACEKDLPVRLPDGVTLYADRYFPRDLGPCPTILSRSVYADRQRGGFIGEIVAGQGFNCVMVSGRGTMGSEGQLDPFRQEQADGLAVLAWLEAQPWFNGSVGTTGASYLGFTQWAIAAGAGDRLAAISPQLIGADIGRAMFPGGAFALEVWLFWCSLIHTQEGSSFQQMFGAYDVGGRVRRAAGRLPLSEGDEAAFGRRFPFWSAWLEAGPEAPYWAPGDHHTALPQVTAPAHLVGGWFDFFIPMLLEDYAALRDAGRQPWLTIGPWSHFATEAASIGQREGLAWMRAHLLGDRAGLRGAPVRYYVLGAEAWREDEVFPPPGTQVQRWYLYGGGGLGRGPPEPSAPDALRYDPADPTPAVGAAYRAQLMMRVRVDNRRHEARNDVLVFTSSPLLEDLEVIGPVEAEVWVHAERPWFDVFVRLCEVLPSGRSVNVCDGLQRVVVTDGSPEEPRCVRVTLAPTASHFAAGRRLRVQVSGGAFPRWARNMGTDEPLATATTLVPVTRWIHHDPARPSAILLPVAVRG
ncbi:MAG: CocE/NonD family hydrolase [Alphaproteobacteria bacterium]|nr:CocE/NonD family hydrolase [Alphaproteobacteria bacterium]